MYISGQKSTFNYLGGKYSYLPWLLPKLDIPCKHFVDVFGGSAVVLINRPPTPIETYNDINSKVVNFFKVLRDQPEGLIRALELTPHSREEYSEAWYSVDDNTVEQARKFFIRTQQSLHAAGAQDKLKGWAISKNDTLCSISEKTNKWIRSIKGLWEIAERLKLVQLECRDFRHILKSLDTRETFFYCDCPYDLTYRSSTRYEFDFALQDFYDLQYWAKKAVGKIAISGYPSPIMLELFTDFHFHEGPYRKNNRSEVKVRECLWTNYKI